MNDQFKGEDPWGSYLDSLEMADPPISAIAVTDYYVTDTYQAVCAAKDAGRLSGIDLVFPNVEMRLDVATVAGKFVNIHLLVSPEDPDHLRELHRFLSRLKFHAHGDDFHCTRDDLIKLGRKSDPNRTSDKSALEQGANQFKVSRDDLRNAFANSEWARANILVAVAGSKTDGTGGVREAADRALRQELEKFADIIFASSVAQREFWLGLRADPPDQLVDRYRSLKPCLHGSDAHGHIDVAQPDQQRYSWIKGAPTFDALRQACIDPAGRAFVGQEPPASAIPSQVIQSLEIQDAPWAQTPRLALNPGLVAIIGARGSGKTALADMIAAGCDAYTYDPRAPSFLGRAKDLLSGSSVKLAWGGGAQVERPIGDLGEAAAAPFSRVCYLSQQFVERLCSADGVTDELIAEIERVIFDAHPVADNDGAVDFADLRERKTARFQSARLRDEASLYDLSERIGSELDKMKQTSSLEAQIKAKEEGIARYEADRSRLITAGSQDRVARLGALSAAAEKVRGYVRWFGSQEQSALALQDEIRSFRSQGAPEILRRTQDRYRAVALQDPEWASFLTDYKGDVDAAVDAKLAYAREQGRIWKGAPPAVSQDPNQPLISTEADLERQTVGLLEAETERLQKLINVDTVTANQFRTLSSRIVVEKGQLDALTERLTDCRAAADRVKQLNDEREGAFARVFEAITAEEALLAELYAPLMKRLADAGGTLQKLSFSVTRTADVEQWATAGEMLFDLRRTGTFRGRGTLHDYAEHTLLGPWEGGTPAEVSAAMRSFRTTHQTELLDLANASKSDPQAYRAWTLRFAKWLYNTEHISLRYSIDYDGTDIGKLSPGTRGIVLLLLYLALDQADDRPLVIDQPEENLDPKSIFDELVGLFIAAKGRRQVIMVTHNANLVVNTDADQIIVASAGPHAKGALPPITYVAGGLEDAQIRKSVCDILEGGEAAFKERARRLRVALER